MSESHDPDTGDSRMVIDESADTSQDRVSDAPDQSTTGQALPESGSAGIGLHADSDRQPVHKKQKRQRKDSAGDSILKEGASPIKKTKKKKDKNAPHKPLNGYVLFLNQNRARILQENPGVEFPDVTKKLAAEWAQLADEKRQPFLQQAEQDRQRYRQELQQYKASDAFRAFQQSLLPADPHSGRAAGGDVVVVRKKPGPKPKNKAAATEPAAGRAAAGPYVTSRTEESPSATPDSWQTPSKSDIPIFTDEFLDHNKVRETELRKLRKMTTEYEEQNAILFKHIDKMKAAEIKLKAEMVQMAEKNVAVEQTLNHLKNEVVAAFANWPIPGTSLYPTLTNIDEFIDQLHRRVVTEDTEKENKENKVAQDKMRQVLRRVVSAADLRLDDKPVATIPSLHNSITKS